MLTFKISHQSPVSKSKKWPNASKQQEQAEPLHTRSYTKLMAAMAISVQKDNGRIKEAMSGTNLLVVSFFLVALLVIEIVGKDKHTPRRACTWGIHGNRPCDEGEKYLRLTNRAPQKLQVSHA